MKHHLPPKKTLALTALLLAMSTGVQADPGVMLGLSHNFGGATGITLKLLSTDRKDRVAAALGLSYFPGQESRAFGLDTSLGYTLQRGAVTLGYDWLNGQVQLGLGVANTRSRAVVVPAPAPEPEVAVVPAPAPKPAAKKPAKAPAPAAEPVAETPVPAPAPQVSSTLEPVTTTDPCAKSAVFGKATGCAG